jgi:hypothetical protein
MHQNGTAVRYTGQLEFVLVTLRQSFAIWCQKREDSALRRRLAPDAAAAARPARQPGAAASNFWTAPKDLPAIAQLLIKGNFVLARLGANGGRAMMKRWRYDGPPHSTQRWEHRWEAFQGKAYPNPYNGSLEDDQALFDRDREQWLEASDRFQQSEARRLRKHMEKRRREKTGNR